MSTKYKATEALAQFLECLRERKKEVGCDVASNFCKAELMRLNPECVTLNMWVMDTSWKFVPTPDEGEPKDPVESENKITELKDTYYRLWSRKIKEGKYDGDVTVEETEEETKPEPENAEVEVKDTHETPTAEQAEDIATKVEATETAPAEEKKGLKLNSDYAKEQYPAISHGNTMVGMLKTFIMDVVRNEVDLTAKESPRTATDINSLIDENIEMKKQIAELTARADKAKDVILNLVKKVKELEQPKSEGVEGL